MKASLPVIAALCLFTACAGITENQLALDPVIQATEKISDSVSRKRAEFFRLKNEYHHSSRREIFFARMIELKTNIRDELAHAEYFQKYNAYYDQGIDYERWKSARDVYRLCRKTLCEMTLELGELAMNNSDNGYAVALFKAVKSEFTDEDFSAYVDQAENFIQNIKQ